MKLMLDTVEYKSKPNDVGKITNRIIHNPVDITIEQLAQEVVKGKSFVPAYLNKKDKNGKIRRSKDCWTSQEIICLDFDEGMGVEQAIKEFKDMACFIYTTFSHTEHNHKFRVVFKLNEILTNYNTYESIIKYLISKYGADEQCKDGSRLFYGGNQLIELNYNNELVVDDLLMEIDEYENGINHAGDFSTPYNKYTENIYRVEKLYECKNKLIDSVKDSYIDEIREGVIPLTHINDMYDYLYQQDIQNFLLDIGALNTYDKTFKCIFHDDSKPSAGIFKDNKTGNYIYKCHSKSCGFIGNIVRVVERIYGVTRLEAFNLLSSHFGIILTETKWQRQQKLILDHNINYLTSNWFKIEHPDLYKRIKKYIPLLLIMNMLAKQYIGSTSLRKIESNIFTVSRGYIAQMCSELEEIINEIDSLEYKKINKDVKEIGKRLSLFSFLGVLNKMHIKDLPPETKGKLVTQRNEKIKKTGNKKINFQDCYSIPHYDDKTLSDANEKAIEFKKSNLSMTGFGREMLIRSTGKESANAVFPMMSEVDLTNKSNQISDYVKEKFLNAINEKGWVMEAEILEKMTQETLNSTNGQLKGKMKNIKAIKKNLNELVEGYGLIRERLNNDLKKKMNIEIKGYPYIIYKNV